MLLDLENEAKADACALPVHIFHLPCEIRDEVYDYLWRDIILAFRQADLVIVARNKRQNLD